MMENFEEQIKRRFAETFGLERLPAFSRDIRKLEEDGLLDEATALRSLMKKQTLKNIPTKD